MRRTLHLLTAAAIALAAVALLLTWRRLFQGCDLGDESFAVLVPWRWSLGDRPFVDEMDLAQVAGFLTFPFIKAFALASGEHAGGLVLFSRHLYLVFVTAVAAVAAASLRRFVSWPLALAVSLVVVTFVFRATPDLTYNTLAMGLLTLGFAIGAMHLGQRAGRRTAALAGLCHGLAVVAFPTLLFVTPFVAIFLVLAHGRQAQALVTDLTWHVPPDPRPEQGDTAPGAFRALVAYAAAGAAPVAVVGVIALLAGPRNVHRCWQFTLQAARNLGQLAGAAKAVDITVGLGGFVASQWPLLAALAAITVVFLLRPRLGRALLALLPLGLYVAGRHGGAEGAGFVIAYGLLTPYLYALLPRWRREQGAALFIWVWPATVVAAAMTAYTSTEGYARGAVGVFPAVLLSGLFLAWNLLAALTPDEGAGVTESAATRRRAVGADRSGAGGVRAGAADWLAFAALAAVVAVTLVLQLQYQQGGATRAQLTARLSSGPWAGISVTPAQRTLIEQAQTDLATYGKPGDALLVYFRSPGLYLSWPYRLATDSVSLQSRPLGDDFAVLPKSTIARYRRTRRVPDIVLHICPPASAAKQNACGGLHYPVTVRRAGYTLALRPAFLTTQKILAALPRQH
jgi:hypothetical protein